MRRKFRESCIVDSHKGISETRIQLQDNLRCHLQVSHRVSARSRKAHATVAQYRRNFNDGDRRRRHRTGTHQVTHLAQVRVDVLDFARVDRLAKTRIALVRHPEAHRTGTRQGAVAAVARRGSRKKRNLEGFPFGVKFLGTRGQSRGHFLGVARQGKARNSQHIAIVNHCRGIGRTTLFRIEPAHSGVKNNFLDFSA